MRVLDSHLHLWDPAHLEYSWLPAPLSRRFAVEEALAAFRADDAEYAAVFVQADCAPEQYLDEVEWVSALAETVGVRGIVAGARLDRGDETVRHLDALAERPLVVGVRHLLQAEDPGFSRTEPFRAGARALVERGMTFDACVRGPEQLDDLIALVTEIPDLPVVLDHLGKPDVGTAGDPHAPSSEWANAMGALAAHPQVHCKLSGLPAEAGGSWSREQVAPFFDVVAEAFGSDRLMFGTDWPVSAVTASGWEGAAHGDFDSQAIATWRRAVTDWATERGHDVDAILRSNAERFYGLTQVGRGGAGR